MAGDPPRSVTLDRNELGALLAAAVPGPAGQPGLLSGLFALLAVVHAHAGRPAMRTGACGIEWGELDE
jgi:hypothetical protein